MSMCMCSKWPTNASNVSVGENTYLVSLHRWHGMHCRDQFRWSLFIDVRTKRVVTKFCVARIPGWESPCSELNTRRKGFGAYGRTLSPNTSQYISTSWSGKRIFFNRNAYVAALTMSRNSMSFSFVQQQECGSLRISLSLRSGIKRLLHYYLVLWCIVCQS